MNRGIAPKYDDDASGLVINQKCIREVPRPSLAKGFDDAVAPFFRQVWVLMEQNKRLRAARDLLLPRLMNGEIVV